MNICSPILKLLHGDRYRKVSRCTSATCSYECTKKVMKELAITKNGKLLLSCVIYILFYFTVTKVM
jgi:hypothetical protein